MIIYCITINNGKKYIGLTKNKAPKGRLIIHKKSKFIIGKAIRKYGIKSIEILYRTKNWNQLKQAEIKYIKEINTRIPFGYNMTEGGEGVLGFRFSKKTRQLLSKLRKGNQHAKGNKLSEESKRKISEKMKGNKHLLGHKHSRKTKKLMSEKLKGNKHTLGWKPSLKTLANMKAANGTEERRKAMSLLSKKLWKDPIWSKKMKKVLRRNNQRNWKDPELINKMLLGGIKGRKIALKNKKKRRLLKRSLNK